MKNLHFLLVAAALAVAVGCAGETTTTTIEKPASNDQGAVASTESIPNNTTEVGPGEPGEQKPEADQKSPTGQPPATNPPTANNTTPPKSNNPTAPAATGGYLLRLKPNKGENFRYELAIKPEGGGQQAAMGAMDAKVRMSVVDSANGNTTMRMTFEDISMPMLAQAPPEQRKQIEDMLKSIAVVYVLDEMGKTISVKTEGGPPGFQQALGGLGGATATFPEGPVKVGDSYTTEQTVQGQTLKSTYKVLAVEQKNGVQSLKLEVKIEEGGRPQTMFMWIDPRNGTLVAMEGTAPMPAGPNGQSSGSIRTTMRRI
jgi:hypothetical protein